MDCSLKGVDGSSSAKAEDRLCCAKQGEEERGKQRQKEKSKHTPRSSVAGDIWEWATLPGVMAVPSKRSAVGGGQEAGKLGSEGTSSLRQEDFGLKGSVILPPTSPGLYISYVDTLIAFLCIVQKCSSKSFSRYDVDRTYIKMF